MDFRRIFLIVLDGFGVGGAPDAAEFGDAGSDTLGNLSRCESLEIPMLSALGLGNLYEDPLPGVPTIAKPLAHHCRLTELSAGKDTTTGHWEMMGIVRETLAPTFPDGFPADFLADFSNRTGRGILGNRPASGTMIIQELGRKHLESGSLIVYTSADSVFQVAAHVGVVPLDELYAICRTARQMLCGELAVDRVIARPFTGNPADGFVRTADRKDFSLDPPGKTTLNLIADAGLESIGIGKISDIFAGSGITRSITEHGNDQLMKCLDSLQTDRSWIGLAFCNLVDFDMLFGHRNNTRGYANALADFDTWLSGFLERLADDELCIITADHGNDPTTESTDHSREQVPLLIVGKDTLTHGGKRLDPSPGFMHAGKTIAALLEVESTLPGDYLLA